MKRILNIYGWLGTVFILIAYALVSFSLINQNSHLYQLLNFFGALGVVLSSYVKKDMQPVVLNIFWGIIAISAFLKLL